MAGWAQQYGLSLVAVALSRLITAWSPAELSPELSLSWGQHHRFYREQMRSMLGAEQRMDAQVKHYSNQLGAPSCASKAAAPPATMSCVGAPRHMLETAALSDASRCGTMQEPRPSMSFPLHSESDTGKGKDHGGAVPATGIGYTCTMCLWQLAGLHFLVPCRHMTLCAECMGKLRTPEFSFPPACGCGATGMAKLQ